MKLDVESRPGAAEGSANAAGAERLYDLAARALLVLVFTVLATLNVVGIFRLIADWPAVDLLQPSLTLAARVSNTLFLMLVVATAITRLAPIRKAKGLQPRVSALLGTSLLMLLGGLPPAQLPPFWSAFSSALVIVGTMLSFLVLHWLGRSFSIMPEARRLVTAGPYRLVRHPLYVCEAIATLGILIQMFSPWAVLIVTIQVLFQLQRMVNEERVLRAAFPDYARYATETPALLPMRLMR